MNSITTKTDSNQTCSRDHQTREKVYAEKYMLRIKKPRARIPATRKYMYTFMDPESTILESRSKTGEYDDERQKHKTSESKKKLTLNYLKYQESSSSPTDLQISEIDKQLKDIRSQKKRINQLIYKELKNTKSSWQEVKDGTDLLNVRNIIDRNDMVRVNQLCEILENTTNQVNSLHHSLTDLGNQKQSRSLKSKQINQQNQNSISSKDDYHVRLLEKPDKALEKNIRKTLDNYTLNTATGYAGSDGAREMLLQREVPLSVRKTFLNIEDNGILYNLGGDSLTDNSNFDKTKCTKTVGTEDSNCKDSSYASVNTSSNIVRKYPVLKNMLPELLKSEYLKKSCNFE